MEILWMGKCFPTLILVVDCLWSGYSDWSSCSSSCGEGLQKRERKVLQPARNGGLTCAGKEEEERVCNLEPCPGE